MTKKSARGVSGPAPMFPSSLSAKIMNIKIALAINSEKNCPVLVMKSAGYVQNIPAVAVSEYPGTVRILDPPSKTSMADL